MQHNTIQLAVIDMAGQNTLAAFTDYPQIDLINDWAYLYDMKEGLHQQEDKADSEKQ